MDDPSVVVERGVLTAPAEVWQLAVCRAEVIGRMPDGIAVGHAAADTAAAELGISRRQVYELLRRWRAGSGGVSDLVPGKSSGGRGREQLSAKLGGDAALVGGIVSGSLVKSAFMTVGRPRAWVAHRWRPAHRGGLAARGGAGGCLSSHKKFRPR